MRGDEPSQTSHLCQPAGSYAVPQPTGPASRFWVLMAILCALAIAGLAGAVVTNLRVNRVQVGAAISERVKERMAEREAEATARQIERQIQDAMREAERAMQRGGIVPPPPPPPASGQAAPPAAPPIVDAEGLIYPGSTVESRKQVGGVQILNMRTGDDLDQIKEFYQRRLGNPPNASTNDKLIFVEKVVGGETVVTVKPHAEDSDDFQIQVVSIGSRPNRVR